MKLALMQMAPAGPLTVPSTSLRDNLCHLGAMGVELVVLPELLLPGYNQPKAHAQAAEQDGITSRAMTALAQEAGLAIAYGWAEREGGAVYNAATIVAATGLILLHYRKRQLFGPIECTSFTPGTTAPGLCDLNGLRLGLLICYDIEFPEHARELARQGCDLLLVPTANPVGYEHVQRLLVPARAYENRMTIAYANYAGQDGELQFGGQSLISGPNGVPLAQAGGTPAILVVDLPEKDSYPAATLSTQLADFIP